jgi:hypothetical protein
VKAWTRQHIWQFAALVWASGIAVAMLGYIFAAYASGGPVDWPAAAVTALIIPLTGSVGLVLGLHQQARRSGTEPKP